MLEFKKTFSVMCSFMQPKPFMYMLAKLFGEALTVKDLVNIYVHIVSWIMYWWRHQTLNTHGFRIGAATTAHDAGISDANIWMLGY